MQNALQFFFQFIFQNKVDPHPMTQPPDPVDTFALLQARPDDPPNLRALRWAVLTMGLVLLAGFGIVIARIVYLTMRPAVSTPVSDQARVGTQSEALAANLTLALPPGAKILSQSVWANRLSVHVEAGGVQSIIIFDLETGRVITRVAITQQTK